MSGSAAFPSLQEKSGPTMSRKQTLVTTFVPSRSLDEDEMREMRDGPAPSLVAALTPSQSRRKALVRLIRNHQGRDVLLQLCQSLSLLMYSFAPSRARRKQMHLLSESISNIRKLMLVARWLIEGSNAIQEQLDESTKGIIVRDVNGLALDKVELNNDDEKKEPTLEEKEEKAISAEQSQKQAVSAWKQSIQDSMGSLSDYLGIGAESCDLMAFFGGSGMLWSILGGKLATRQRRGLERVALFLGFLSMLFGMLHLRYQRGRQRQRLRIANQHLMKATDKVMESGSETLLQGHLLRPEQALSHDSKSRNIIKSREINHLSPIETLLRTTERQLYVEKKKLEHLGLERIALRSELIFVLVELLWPYNDHSRLEGYTGIVASLCNISRLASESRWRVC